MEIGEAPQGPTCTLRILSMLGSITKIFQSPAQKKASSAWGL